jgi:hypothetical protein
MVNIYSDTMNGVINILTPKRIVVVRRKRKLKLTWKTRDLMREQDRVRKHDPAMYKHLRNNCNMMVREDQMRATSDRLAKASSPSEVWKVVSDISNPKTDQVQVVTDNNDTDLTKEGAADAFNDCFIKKIEALIEKIPDAKETDPFLGRRKRADRKNLAFSLTTVSVGEVTKIILGLKNLKATGVDGIPTSILKEGVEVLALPITWIINQSIETGTFPKKWKESIVVPILKKGNPRTMKNYRPVSNLCKTSKVLETVVMRHLSNFFEKNKLLPENQHGFRRNRSMVTAITSLDSIWAKLRAGGDCIGVTAFDLSAAFDIVPHDLLMRKMEVYGVTEKESSWIWSFLSDRTQRIRWGKSLSSPRAVPFGTPQGSCLSPLLFLIYTADLEEYLKKECANSYADGTTTGRY